MFTMVASRTTINCAAAITMSARPRLRGRGAILRSVAAAVEMSMLMHAKPFWQADYSTQDPVLWGDYISGFVLGDRVGVRLSARSRPAPQAPTRRAREAGGSRRS